MTQAETPATGEVDAIAPVTAAGVGAHPAFDAVDLLPRAQRLLIVLDIDGTVLLPDESLSPGTVDAVEHARRAGHEVMIATGRSWEGTRGVLNVLGIAPEFVVCSNGAVVLRRTSSADLDYERWRVETFDPRVVLQALRTHLPDAHYLVELADGERLYTEYMEHWNLIEARRVEFDELWAEPVCRVVVVAPEHEADDFNELIDSIGLSHVSYAVGWSAWLDIAPRDVDKSTGLERVRTELGVDFADVVVIGDGRNDLGMLEWSLRGGGRAVAMSQGPREVRDAAGELTGSVENGGVAQVLNRL